MNAGIQFNGNDSLIIKHRIFDKVGEFSGRYPDVASISPDSLSKTRHQLIHWYVGYRFESDSGVHFQSNKHMSNTPKSINIAVADQLKTLGSTQVISIVVNRLAEKEINNRADILATAVVLSEFLNRDLNKSSKADSVSYNPDGSINSETFTKQGLDAKKKAEQRIEQLEKLFDQAISQDKWAELNQFVKNNDPKSNQNKSPTASETMPA